MMRAVLFVLAGGLFSSSASAIPALTQGNLVSALDRIVEVKIVCTEDGYCERAPRRRPMARWVYGDGAFFGPGPYSGPGNYGSPGSHWRWFPFFGL